MYCSFTLGACIQGRVTSNIKDLSSAFAFMCASLNYGHFNLINALRVYNGEFWKRIFVLNTFVIMLLPRLVKEPLLLFCCGFGVTLYFFLIVFTLLAIFHNKQDVIFSDPNQRLSSIWQWHANTERPKHRQLTSVWLLLPRLQVVVVCLWGFEAESQDWRQSGVRAGRLV